MTINTGTPGFDIDGKTYTYDVGPKDAPDDPKYPIDTDKGAVNVDKSIRDISKKTKKTLGEYLGSKTSINYYPVDSESSETSLTAQGLDNKTPALPSSEEPTHNSQYFTKGRTDAPNVTPARSTLHSWMTQGHVGDKQYTAIDPTSAGVNKGKSTSNSPTGKNGNELLPSVTGGTVTDNGPVGTYTQSILANNRFTTDDRYANIDVNDPRGYNPAVHSPRYGRFTVGRMAQVGISLSIRSSRELNSAQSGQNPSSGGTEGKALLPSVNQMGASKVDTILLEARDVFNNLSEAEVPNSQLINIHSDSWGSLNNVLDPYSGITALGMIALSTALTAGVTLVFEGLGFLLSAIKSGKTDPRKNPDGRFILGRSTVTKQANPNAFPPNFPPDIGALLGLHATVKPFSDCLKKGIIAFFGIDDSSAGSAILSGLSSAASAPGYNAVVARAIIRSTTTVIDSIKKVASSGNLISGVKNILSLVETLRSSKLISAINVFATLGDAVLSSNADDWIKGRDEEPYRVSSLDNLPDDIAYNAAVKSRMGRGNDIKLKLAWSNNRAPSLLLLPSSVAGLQGKGRNLGSFQPGLGMQETNTRSYYKLLTDNDANSKDGSGYRIPIGSNKDSMDEMTLRNMERMLDAEYVPFYFHDVRTNEIIGFHAFLASLSDDYTPSYESSEGFGRVEPVKIYKNTTRKIGLSFYIAATSPNDFNDMWVKINKLTTLVYPQYTEGRRLTDGADGNYSFTQPFSQMIGAAPLIRIRLGNLFASNYSRFNLARLFGATLKGAKFNGVDMDLDGSNYQYLSSRIEAALSSGDNTIKWYVVPGVVSDKSDKSGMALSLSIGTSGIGGGKSAAPKWSTGPESIYMPVTVKIDSDNPALAHVTVQVPTEQFLIDQGVSSPSQQATIISYIKKQFNNSDNPKQFVVNSTYAVPTEYIRPTKASFMKIFPETFNDSAADIKNLTEFMDSDKNAVVRSFKSAGGKGLAGFLDSLNFDWYDKVMWDTSAGNKAPMMCKVTIGFSPIHDITPGLDSQGYNRAPIYPVGFYSIQDDDNKGGK